MSNSKELSKLIKKDPAAIGSYMPLVLQVIRDDEEVLEASDELTTALRNHCFEEIKSKPNQYDQAMLELCEVCLGKRTTKYYELAAVMFKRKEIIKWKDQIEMAEKLVRMFETPGELVRTKNDDWWGKDTKPSSTEIGKAIECCVQAMMEAFDRDKILKKVSKCMVELLVALFKSPKDLQIVTGKAFVSYSWQPICWEGTERILPRMYRAMYEWMTTAKLDLDDSWDDKTKFINETLSASLSRAGSPSKYAKEVSEIFQYVLTHELDGQPFTGWGLIAQTICGKFVSEHCASQRVIKDFVPGVIKLLQCEAEPLITSASICISRFYQQGDLIAPWADELIEAFLQGKTDYLGVVLRPLYGERPEKIISRIDELAESMEDNHSNKSMVYMLWLDVVQDYPEKLVPYVDLMMDDVTNGHLGNQLIMVLGRLSVKFPDLFIDKLEKLLRVAKQRPHAIYGVDTVVASVGLINEEQANRCLGILVDKLKTSEDTWLSSILLEMKRIGQKYVDVLKKYRAEIEPFKYSQAKGVPDLVQSLIDFMEGRSLDVLAGDVEEVKDEVQSLDNRVTETEQNVDRLDQTVTEQGQEIENVKNEVAEQGERLDVLEDTVDDLIVKVDEIDHKTITNAPKWARDISKLLNPEHEYDWRFLAIRLGFTGEDIRSWALSPDPTMAILAEWYTIHKSSEATYAVLTALQDMGRDDAAAIVEEALQAADALVPKAAPDVPEKPPRVFISYQWDHQPEVKAIRDHLEKAGFSCWLDIGQMGGGDSLFAKINEGMRAAKVVLCMCTEKYSKSENCNKEVNLANLLNKPIIPILIEKIAWPPAGSMSMLFAQLLYIQFFNDKEYIRGEKFWDDAKFAELLGQITYYVAPDEEMITDEYRSWVPQVDDLPIVVKKADDKAPAATTPQSTAQNEEGQELVPQVFISYQWDKQPEIKTLYSRLTSLGFSCWLDILQMGGGDALYSKIDKGIRNAKVVVSSVTPTYALSANCRREVSLSDALRKPVIPLLMQQMTWPPEGPMSMPFAQLLYIDCTKESTQAEFNDAKFDELVQKIKEHATVEEAIIQQTAAQNASKDKREEPPAFVENIPKPETKAGPSPAETEDRPQSRSGPKHAKVVQQENTSPPEQSAKSGPASADRTPKPETKAVPSPAVTEERPQSGAGPKNAEVIQQETASPATKPAKSGSPKPKKKKKKSSVCEIF